jgi:hypothetical protein
MRVEEIRDWLAGLLDGQPGIERVEDYAVPENKHELTDKVVRCTDGRSIFLRIVRSSPPGGEQNGDSGAAREPGTEIVVTGEAG